MSMEICAEEARRRAKLNLVKKVDVSFKCLRKNELMKERDLEDASAWGIARAESKIIFGR